MNEFENTGMEMNDTADQQDAFLDGWTDSETGAADQPETDADGLAQETEGTADPAEPDTESAADTTDTEAKADTTADAEAADGGQQEESGATRAPQWVIKHNGTETTVRAEDITPELLQKGVDYDRIRGKYDEAKPVMEMFSGLAKASGMSVQDYIRTVRSAVKKAEGLNDEEARRAIDLEDREAAVSAKEAEQQENEAAASEQSAHIDSAIREFASAFPDVYKQAELDPKTIPDSVWADVRRGMSLTAAYARYAVESANSAAKAAQDKADAAVFDLSCRLGVDERPARGVDDNDALLHLFDGGGVDHVDGLRRERAVQ